MARSSLVTLLTDFGTRDHYVAAMKGVLLSRCPRCQIVDITHEVPAHDVLAGAVTLAHAARCFPPETLHIVVVDPGVGADRRILAGRFGGQTFLFPDNGVITLVAEAMPLEALAVVSNTALLPPPTAARTFQGRDIFAPVGAHLLNGLDLRVLGPAPQTFKMLETPQPRVTPEGIAGQVIHVDSFGNLISNIPGVLLRQTWPDLERVRVWCDGRDVGPLVGTYAFAPEGALLALLNSMGLVEVAVNRGRACDVLQAGMLAEVRVGLAR